MKPLQIPSPKRPSALRSPSWRTLSLALGLAAVLGGSPSARGVQGVNLLVNPSFEEDLTGWTVVSSTPAVVPYGSTNAPSTQLGTHIGGGGKFLRDSGGNAVVRQSVSLGAVPPGTHVHAGGYFGGLQADGARLVVIFQGASSEISRENLDPVTKATRNSEPVLMRREATFPIPSGTQSVIAQVEILEDGFSSRLGAADALFLELVSAPATPAPAPLGVNLLTNPRFEHGWATGSPLTPTDPRGWYGVTPDRTVVVKPYTDADPLTPSEEVSCIVTGGEPGTSCTFGGAGNLLADLGGTGSLRQRIDLRGNAAQIAAGLEMRVSALLGGYAGDADGAQVQIGFLDGNGNSIGTLVALATVTREARQSQTILLQRERVLTVPAATGFLEFNVVFPIDGFSGNHGLADNLSLELRLPTPLPPVIPNTEQMSNGSFENGSFGGTPLELTNPNGWFGVASTTQLPGYGTSTSVPSLAFAQANGLGGLLLRDQGRNAILRRVIDLRGSHDAVAQGRYSAYVEAWLGGSGTSVDSAQVELTFLASPTGVGGVQVGPVTYLERVTPQERENAATLVRRSAQVSVPVNADLLQVDLEFLDDGFSTSNGLADGVRVVLFDQIEGGPLLYPGSRGDLRLLSGVGATPTTGPGQDVKLARAHDVLNVSVLSPEGTHDFAQLLLGANVFPTGMRPSLPKFGFPGLALDPTRLLVLADGRGCSGFGCSSVLPGGTDFTFAVPQGLAGTSVLLQAFVRTTSPLRPRAALVASEAHEIRIVP